MSNWKLRLILWLIQHSMVRLALLFMTDEQADNLAADIRKAIAKYMKRENR